MIRNRAYWDGGLIDNTPAQAVIDNLRGEEPETMPIFMIDVNTSSAPPPAVPCAKQPSGCWRCLRGTG